MATAKVEMTTAQVARRLGVSETRVRQLTLAGKLKSRTTPLGRLYREDAVESYEEAREAVR